MYLCLGWWGGGGGIKREEEKHTILQTPFYIFATLLCFSLSPELIYNYFFGKIFPDVPTNLTDWFIYKVICSTFTTEHLSFIFFTDFLLCTCISEWWWHNTKIYFYVNFLIFLLLLFVAKKHTWNSNISAIFTIVILLWVFEFRKYFVSMGVLSIAIPE